MALKTSVSRNTRESKLNRLGGTMAVKAAMDANDPDVKKMKKYKQLWQQFKERINRKYGSRGMVAARKSSFR